MVSKKDIRAQVRRAFAGRSAEELALAGSSACAGVLAYVDSFAKPGMTILLYWALPDEVQTSGLVEALSLAGHTVLLPSVVVGDDLELRVYHGLSSMAPGPFGILEPQLPGSLLASCEPVPSGSLPASCEPCIRDAARQSGAFTDYAAIDLAVVPGRAFTLDGARLGRGRGYYDRLLPHLSCPKIGLCFPWQVVPAIPMDAHDIPMDQVICR